MLGPPARAYAALQRLQSLAESQCDLESDMTKCGVFSPAATDAEMGFIPASIEGSPRYVGDKHAGRLRARRRRRVGGVRFIFGKLVSRLPALARMRDSGRLQVAAQARTLLLRYCANPRAGFWLRMHLVQRVAATFDDAIEACLVCSAPTTRGGAGAQAGTAARAAWLTSAEGQADAACVLVADAALLPRAHLCATAPYSSFRQRSYPYVACSNCRRSQSPTSS